MEGWPWERNNRWSARSFQRLQTISSSISSLILLSSTSAGFLLSGKFQLMIQQRIGPGDGMKRTRQWAANHFLSSSLSLIQINGLAAVNLSFSFRTPSITRRNPLSCVSMLLIFWMLSQQNFFSFLIHAFKVKNSSSTTLKRKRAPELLTPLRKGPQKPHVIEEFFCGSDRQSLTVPLLFHLMFTSLWIQLQLLSALLGSSGLLSLHYF